MASVDVGLQTLMECIELQVGIPKHTAQANLDLLTKKKKSASFI